MNELSKFTTDNSVFKKKPSGNGMGIQSRIAKTV